MEGTWSDTDQEVIDPASSSGPAQPVRKQRVKKRPVNKKPASPKKRPSGARRRPASVIRRPAGPHAAKAAASFEAAKVLAASALMPSRPQMPQTVDRPDGFTLRVGSDCSGMCSEVLALELLLVPGRHSMTHVFASDKEAWIRSFIKKVHSNVLTVWDDINERDVNAMSHVHLYHSGFPCTPFSKSGTQAGAVDPNGNVFFSCYKYIARWLPSTFILENVASLPADFPDTFELMLKMLAEIMEGTKGAYSIQFKIFNCLDYGLPQSRARVYVAGVRRTHMVNTFEWPAPSPTMRSLSSILDLPSMGEPAPKPMSATNIKNLNSIMTKMIDQNRELEFVNQEYIHDLVSSKPGSSLDKCMTLTKTRCTANQGYYCSKRNRPLYVADFLRLNGIPAKRFKGWYNHISRTRMASMCGNGEALNVLTPIVKACLHSIGMEDTLSPDWTTMDLL